jgi:hypothetical protein
MRPSKSPSVTTERKSIDLEDVRPIALPGGTVVFAQSYTETAHGAQISAGEVPVATAGNAEVLSA